MSGSPPKKKNSKDGTAPPTTTQTATPTPTSTTSAPTTSSRPNLIRVVEVLNKDIYQDALLQSATKIVVLEFYAPWCGSCRMLGMAMEELANEYKDQVHMFRINVDDFDEITEEYGVHMVPTTIFLSAKEKVAECIGNNREKLEEALLKAVADQHKPRGR